MKIEIIKNQPKEPDLSDKRVKLGFTNDVGFRLSQHRTSAPTAKLIKHWGCKRAWEPAAIDCATRMCTSIGQEVFDIDNMDFVISRLDSFFAVMSNDMVGSQQK